MSQPTRRVFMLRSAACCAAAAAMAPLAQAANLKRVEESEPKAASLGYRHDATKVDTKRFPKYKAGEKCTNCMAWLGKASDAWSECDLMPDRLVSGTGWCSSYVKLG